MVVCGYSTQIHCSVQIVHRIKKLIGYWWESCCWTVLFSYVWICLVSLLVRLRLIVCKEQEKSWLQFNRPLSRKTSHDAISCPLFSFAHRRFVKTAHHLPSQHRRNGPPCINNNIVVPGACVLVCFCVVLVNRTTRWTHKHTHIETPDADFVQLNARVHMNTGPKHIHNI